MSEGYVLLARHFLERWKAPPDGDWMMPTKELATLLRSTAATERESCAMACEKLGASGVQCEDGEWAPFDDVYGGRQATEQCAQAIRNRGRHLETGQP
jgi:hypothetical protein